MRERKALSPLDQLKNLTDALADDMPVEQENAEQASLIKDALIRFAEEAEARAAGNSEKPKLTTIPINQRSRPSAPRTSQPAPHTLRPAAKTDQPPSSITRTLPKT